MSEKNYKATTGVDEFHYGELDSTDVVLDVPERVKFLQNITVEMPQEAVRAYGDNKTAEIAIAAGDITVNSSFHTLPIEDKARLLGLEKVNGIYSHGSEDQPPYVAAAFSKTYEDGSTEWVGLTKGMFLRPNKTGQTKTSGVEFTSEEISAQFMDRKVEGFTKEKSVLFARDEKGSTTNRDELFTLVFGQPHPNFEPEGV